MSKPKLRKKVLKNGEVMGPVRINDRDIIFSDTSSYDSIAEMLSHATRRSRPVENYFQHNRAVKESYHELSYATKILNLAEREPSGDAYEFRKAFLYNNSNLARGRVSCFLHVPLGMLTRLLNDFVDVERVAKPCSSCVHEKWNLYVTTRHLNEIEKKIREFFDSKSKLCRRCRLKCGRFADTLPLLSIATEHNHPLSPRFRRDNGESESNKSSLDVLPVSMTIDDCVYLLCGVIGRTVSADSTSYHYVAFCRHANGRWDKRDSFDEEIKSLSEIPLVRISQIFYVNIGYWDGTERKSLIGPAITAWYQLTNVELPELCVRRILGYLDNEQLKVLIAGAEVVSLEN